MSQCPSEPSPNSQVFHSAAASQVRRTVEDWPFPRETSPTTRSADEVIVGNLTRSELRRRFWHIAPGVLAFLMPLIYHRDPISTRLNVILISVTVAITYLLMRDSRRIVRRGERSLAAPVAGYAFSVVGTWLLFPAHAELGLAVLMVLAFGDGLATLGGLTFGGRRLPWNRDKTWTGSLCFLAGSVPTAIWAFWAEARPAVDLEVAVVCGSAAALAGAVAESLPIGLNDNARVGGGAIVGIVAAYAFFAPTLF